jgi:predicted MFS family arabinose efflux permease
MVADVVPACQQRTPHQADIGTPIEEMTTPCSVQNVVALDTSRPRWRFAFTGVLALGMVAATQMPAGLGILAPFIRDDLGVSRTQIGTLITTLLVLAAFVSPLTGRVTDLLGGRRSIMLLFLSAAVGVIGVAVAPSYWWMLLPVATAAFAQAGGNPITNKLIATHTPAGRRGMVIGIKQSGVQAGIFVSGLSMPAIAETWGWRWAIGVVLIVPIIGFLITVIALPADQRTKTEHAAIADLRTEPLPRAITFLAVYGGLMGFGAAYTFFIPLFAQDALGMTERSGGAAAGLIGFVSLFARIAWSRYADAHRRHDRALAIVAVGSVAAVVVFMVAQAGASWLLWVGAVITAVSSSSWNSVGMVAVIDHAGEERSGRASGIVMFGFLIGLGVAPTLFGWLVDRTDSYNSMWVASLVALGLAAILSLWWLRSGRTPDVR